MMIAKAWLTYLLFGCLTIAAIAAKSRAAERTVGDYQKELETYYKKIRSVHLRYSQTVAREQNSPIMREFEAFAAKEREIGVRQNKTPRVGGQAELPTLLEHDERATIEYELVEKFPLIALTKHAHLSRNGIDATEYVSKYLCKNTYYQLSSHSKSLIESSKIDMGMFDESPVNAIGKRMLHSINQPLSDLLLSPDAMIVEGVSPSDEVVVIKAGPDFSDASRPAKLSPGAFVLVHLKKADPIRPWKIVVDMNVLKQPNKGFEQIQGTLTQESEMSDYRDVPEGTSGATISFPFHFRNRNLSGVTEWQIITAAINPDLPDSTFVPKVPEGYSVTKNERATITIMKGGASVRDQVARETVNKAKRLLNQPIPPAENQQTSLSLVANLTTCVVIAGLVVIYRRR